MIQCILSGCNGRMGKVITELCEGDPDFRIVAGVDVAGKPAGDYPVYGSFDEIREKADVCIDFSSPKAFDSMMDYAVKTGTAAVICTTGLSEEQIHRIELESAKIAVLRSANMSLGVNLLLGLVREAAEKLSKRGFDIEIVERHHNQKKDAPSGTALALAEAINEGCDQRYSYAYDRSDRLEVRRKNEIGHEVIFAGPDEVIEFSHIAYSRAIFGNGAISAAKFLAGKREGFYTMREVIGT